MFLFEVKQTVFDGVLQPFSETLRGKQAETLVSASGPDKPVRYWILSQSHKDLRDPQNAPSISMWGFLLASAQTQRLNEISIYVANGATANELRFLYMNDVALAVWKEMGRQVTIKGRLQRPPRGAILSFGMPFSE